MSPDALFPMINLTAVAGWLLLIVAPRDRRATAVAATLIPLLFSVAYVGLLAVHWRETPGGFSSLAGVSALFSNQWLLLAGWVHYLAFDLLVGAWEARDAVEKGISRWLVAPCLLLTLLFGPAGWLSYRLLRAVRDRSRPQGPAPTGATS